LYNPYQGLNAAVSSSGGQQPAYKLPRQPEFLFQEEAAVHRRSWSENLTFYTGSGYLSGAILGGSRGAFEALRVPPPDTALNTTRLRLNRLLNLSGKNGRAAGHTLGVLGLFFSSAESLIGYFNDQSVPEAVNSVAAGALSGALYRAPRGLRTAGVAGGIGAVAASALVYARNNLSKGL
jgi:import inner membrane translocase subunit TIM23